MPHACLPQRQFKIDRYKAKSLLKIPGHAKLLTIFGFVGRYKGHDLAVNALKQLPEDYRLAICGGAHPESRDDFLTRLMCQIKEAGLEDRVTITGWLPTESAELYYAATDICLAPYRADSGLSASGALTWALSSNRPIIASKIDAFQPIQRESGAMMMITADALEELCWAIQRLADDEVLQERLVQAAGNYVEKHSWRKNAENTIQLYEQMLFQQGRRSGRPHSDPVLVKIFAEDQGAGADQESEDSGAAAEKTDAA
jgi:glycosyltransferase involved in cell wall biosynthesis